MPTSITPPPADDEIECGNCGAYFHYELTRCPNCGANVYGSDEDSESSSERTPALRRKNMLDRLDGFFHRLFKKPYRADELFGAAINQAELFNNLLLKVGGDRLAAERLIEFERAKLPNGNRMTWIKNAIQRWEQDNRSRKP